MDRPLVEHLAVLALAGGLAVMGCGGGSDEGGGAAPASQEQRGAKIEDGGSGEGEDGESGSSQSNSIDQSSSSSQSSSSNQSSSQSNSIDQSSDGTSISSSSSSSNVNGRTTKTFSGTGSTNLTFNVERPSRFAWTNSEGGRFSVSGGGISIDSRAGRGEVALEPGRYEAVRVRGSSWTIVIRSR